MRRVLMMIGLLAACSPAAAKDLYVSPGGNDAVTYAANSPAAPWRTIGRAAWGSSSKSTPVASQAAQAGDVVRIAGGTYVTVGNLTGGGGGRQDVAYQPVNSGTATAPVRFQCEGTCVLTYSSGAGPMIGSTDRNYIQWSGFTISESTAPTRSDTGPVTFFRVTGGSIENSTLTGNPNWRERMGDNYTGVRLEDAIGVRIAGNTITGYGGQTGDRNHACIETYRSFPILIEQNLLDYCGSGIYLKGTSPTLTVRSVVVRLNIFSRNRYALHALQTPGTMAEPMLFYQNLFRNNTEAGLWIAAFANDQYDAKWVRFFNNTLVDNAAGIASYNWQAFPAGANFLWANNIVAGTGDRLRMDNTNDAQNLLPTVHSLNRNVYATERFQTGGTARSLAYLRGFGQDVDSIVADPQFVGPDDFRLAPGSPARTVGRAMHGIGGATGAVIPAGAYITGTEQIGPGGAAPPPPPPPPPPTPVDCVVSAWALSSAGPWGACTAGSQTRSEQWARTVITEPAHGGQACPALTETRTATQACTVEPPPPPPDEDVLTAIRAALQRIEAAVSGPAAIVCTVTSTTVNTFRVQCPDGTFPRPATGSTVRVIPQP